MNGTDVLLAATTLLASFGGYLLAGRNEARRDARASAREKKIREDEAAARREEVSHRIQLETLMALQEDVQLHARHCGRAAHFDLMRAREGELTALPEEWSEEELVTAMRMKRNASRTLDGRVREAVDELNQTTTRIALDFERLQGLRGDDLESAARARLAGLAEVTNRTNSTIGVALRRELAWEPASPTSPSQASRT